MAKSWIAQAVNVFQNEDRSTGESFPGPSYGSSRRPDRVRMIVGNERSLLASVYTRLAVDSAMVLQRHCRVNENEEFLEFIQSGLNDCLQFEANIDQNAQHLILDAVMTMLDRGTAALVPVDALVSSVTGDIIDVKTIRVGYVQEFLSQSQKVRVSVWNERTGQRQDVTMPKKNVALVENPYAAVMNEPNSTLQRLNRKLQLLDMSDDRVSSGKLDVLVKFPFQVRGERKEQDAARRIEDLEKQLNNNQIGVAWIDATEQVIQLNRSVENKLLEQVKQLRLDLFSELGLTPEILNGTADSEALVNYISRTLEPILTAFTQEMTRKFITKTARTQGARVKYFPNLFKLIPLKDLAEIADKLSRNEIVTSNEFRAFLGLRPSNDPKADTLRNPNMPGAMDGILPPEAGGPESEADTIPLDPNAEVDNLSSDFEDEINSLMQSDMEEDMHEDELSHVYDPVKRRQYYLRTRKLKGRAKAEAKANPPSFQTGPTNRARANAIGKNATKNLGSDRTRAVRRLVNETKRQLDKLTEDFRSWVDDHPKATPQEKEVQRQKVLAQKNVAIKNLKTAVGKITAEASSKKTPTGGTEGRHH